MVRERWGTFSVADHKHDHAFTIEVLLYDRLVIPVPPNNADEKKRWVKAKWKPDRLASYLDILGDELVLKVKWGEGEQKMFKKRQEAADTINAELNFGLTRLLLANEFKPELPEGVAKASP